MSGAGCQKKCNHETITERRGGDGCCPEGATNDEDSDCLPTCGNGVVDEGEYCDIGITVTQTGICPTSCHDGNPCTEDILEGSGCQRRCEYPAIVDAVANDGCCPPGHTVVTDGDCPALLFDGTPRTICDRGYQWHVPTVAAGPDRYAVGCLPKGSQNTTPYLYFTDGLGITLSTQTLLTSDGYYYKDNQLSFHDNRFQVVYEYNCDDAGNWRVGWGWGCVDFREYDTSGSLLANPPAFGERGHNGHPVLDWSGTEFGVAWVSYDDFYFRRIDSDRQLIGEDPYENIYIGKDPDQSDARSGARTKIAWDLENGGYGIFVIIGGEIYFQRISIDGTVLVSTRSLGAGYSQTFGGQFVALYHAGAYSLVYPDGEKLLFKRIGLDGSIQASVTVAGHNVRQPHMFRKGDHFYVTYNEADGHARVKVYDTSATAVPGKSGPIGDGRTMTAPVSTYDPTYGRIAIVYLDANQKVVFQRLKESN